MHDKEFARRLRQLPLVAILRGINAPEASAIVGALIEQGFGLIEVPLNSPAPFDTLEEIVDRFGEQAMIGAGTVITVEQVHRIADIGCKLVVSPNCNTDVISAARRRHLAVVPGIVTPTEALVAIAAGATALKLFPAEGFSPAYLKAMKAILPPDVLVLPVGGISPGNIAPWIAAGAAGFGLGSGLYRPGLEPPQVAELAKNYVLGFEGLPQ